MDKITCCKDCELRYIGCHSECEIYMEEKEKYLLQKQKEKDIKNGHVAQYLYEQSARKNMVTKRRTNK